MLVNNGGGGIFSFLPVAGEVPDDTFTALWATPQHVDLMGAHLHATEQLCPADLHGLSCLAEINADVVTQPEARLSSHVLLDVKTVSAPSVASTLHHRTLDDGAYVLSVQECAVHMAFRIRKCSAQPI